jgi:ribonuclease HII
MSTEVGRQAEQIVAEYLRRRGHRIMAQNWRTRWCEIDIVSVKDRRVYFVEVKYRRSTDWGGGLDYITPQKIAQMHFAAEFWLARHTRMTVDYRLAAAEVSGSDFSVTAWLDEL